MTTPTKVNLKVYQGSTFSQTIRWEKDTKVYSPITNIVRTAPMVVQSPSHGVPSGWRVKIVGALGMKEVNTGEYLVASVTDANTITFNQVNAVGYNTYTGGGVLEYHQPHDLAGYTAKMQIRTSVSSDVVIKELTTENGLIVVDNTLKTIGITIPAGDTAAFNFKTAVYSLELIKGSVVTPFITGNVSLVKEVTR